VERLEGSYSGVVGLPLAETALLLMRAGVRVL
jgi:predicted house-cleaning NTP pyrophosphatase (Maf/HAM1 superfamily)